MISYNDKNFDPELPLLKRMRLEDHKFKACLGSGG